MINILIAAVVALIVGCVAGYYIFRYVIKGKYNRMIEAANKEADVIKEKKLLEVKEKFLNKKSELDKEIQAHNQRMQAGDNKLKQREISLNQKQQELAKIRQDMEREQQRMEMRSSSWRPSSRNLTRCRARSARSWRKYPASRPRRPKNVSWKA